MARGWESKSIEAQQEDAGRSRVLQPSLSGEQRLTAARRRTLELTRARALDDLSRATAPGHRRMLEQTIAAVDEQIARLTS